MLLGARRAGLSDLFLEYLTELYGHSDTALSFDGKERLVSPTTAVRQRDPMSPFLFNLVLDEWFSRQEGYVGFSSGNIFVDAMAFADDKLVMAPTPMALQAQRCDLEEFLSPRRLVINASKSFALSMVPCRDRKWKIDTETTIYVGAQALPITNTASIWKYLGIGFPVKGREAVPIQDQNAEVLTRLSKAPLKPQQHLVVLRYYLLPRLYHRSVLVPWNIKKLTKMDTLVRAAVRQWLSLPHVTPIGYFYAPITSGGLGIPSIRSKIRGLQHPRIIFLETSSHPSVISVVG